MLQYLRKVRVKLLGSAGSKLINPGPDTDDQIQISFAISKGLSSTANTAHIEIWNLAPGTRNAVGKEFDGIELEAGYWPEEGVSNAGLIFKGALRDIEHRKEGNNIITSIDCGDGDKALRRATISKTYPAGTPVGEVVDGIYEELEKEGAVRGEVKGLDKLPPYRRPYSMCGSCEREMDRIGRSHGLYWSLQNETFEVLPGDGYIGGIVLLTPDTGLIGTPTLTDNGVKVEALLNPQIRPGRRVQIESATLEMNSEGGMYRAGNVYFSGNNRTGDMKVAIHAERIQNGKVDEGKAIERRPAE